MTCQDDSKIQTLLDFNEIQDESHTVIAALEQCQPIAAKNSWSEYVTKPVCQSQWEEMVRKAVEPIAGDNPYNFLQPGEISAIESINHNQGSFGLDSRPRISEIIAA